MERRISEAPDWDLFETIAHALEQGLPGLWTHKTDGVDQRYWDLLVDGQTLTLHLEHYLGISLLVDGEAHSVELIAKAYRLIGPHVAAQFDSEWKR